MQVRYLTAICWVYRLRAFAGSATFSALVPFRAENSAQAAWIFLPLGCSIGVEHFLTVGS